MHKPRLAASRTATAEKNFTWDHRRRHLSSVLWLRAALAPTRVSDLKQHLKLRQDAAQRTLHELMLEGSLRA